jgi:hypothetical protein
MLLNFKENMVWRKDGESETPSIFLHLHKIETQQVCDYGRSGVAWKSMGVQQ